MPRSYRGRNLQFTSRRIGIGLNWEKLAEVRIHNTDQEANLRILQCLSSDFEVDKNVLQYAPNLTLALIQDRVRITYRELEASKRKVVN